MNYFSWPRLKVQVQSTGQKYPCHCLITHDPVLSCEIPDLSIESYFSSAHGRWNPYLSSKGQFYPAFSTNIKYIKDGLVISSSESGSHSSVSCDSLYTYQGSVSHKYLSIDSLHSYQGYGSNKCVSIESLYSYQGIGSHNVVSSDYLYSSQGSVRNSSVTPCTHINAQGVIPVCPATPWTHINALGP